MRGAVDVELACPGVGVVDRRGSLQRGRPIGEWDREAFRVDQERVAGDVSLIALVEQLDSRRYGDAFDVDHAQLQGPLAARTGRARGREQAEDRPLHERLRYTPSWRRG